ncbi:MAG: PIN domain nuclease [Candidatus Dormibacter sp.]|uniref:PIN domain nuclease n=1 Tax=Candidatus Dormibacter sp. TaxID=2973982 RepID=UPI000DB50A4C|nr:MAG: VapC toxin family PIN domain ribonuclease [Candidatus Dormibacteraeota bacterium]
MLNARYLVDKSAFARKSHPDVARVIDPLIATGSLARCGIFELEVFYSARNAEELDNDRRDLSLALPLADTRQDDFERAADYLGLLAKRGLHRSVPIPDLVLAAVAERSGLTVLHYDRDFEALRAVVGLDAEWVMPQGSVP